MPGVSKAKVEKAKAVYMKQRAAQDAAERALAKAVIRRAPATEIESLTREAELAANAADGTHDALKLMGIKV